MDIIMKHDRTGTELYFKFYDRNEKDMQIQIDMEDVDMLWNIIVIW